MEVGSTKILYWFRRDLRLRDNRALSAACRAGEVAAVYVFDQDELRDREMGNDDPRFRFLLDVLSHIGKKIRLHVFYGRVVEVFEELMGRARFDALYTATPMSWTEEARFREVENLCRRHGVRLVTVQDNVLVDPSAIESAQSFTQFYARWRGLVDSRTEDEVSNAKFIEIDAPDLAELASRHGWRLSGHAIWSVEMLQRRLETFNFEAYAELRDYPYMDGSSKLSPYISVGAVSVRELYNKAVGRSEEFIRQLAWREFYYHLGRRFPWMRRLELKPHMRGIEWENDTSLFTAFTEGRTGYPIVDAGIRQLKRENWIHNRVRLVVANFLVKDLHVDWRLGERFFKRYLIDYDEVLNVGNWQWSASVGVDTLPLRIFNPVNQAEKYDPDCVYIKRYVPELEEYDCRILQNPVKHRIPGYHEPIVDHQERIRRFKELVDRSRRSSSRKWARIGG